MRVGLVYPHQLYADQLACQGVGVVVLVEDPLFFKQYPFHRQKLMLHRASMKRYADVLQQHGQRVIYLEASNLQHSGDIVQLLKLQKATVLQCVEVSDDWLQQRLQAACITNNIALKLLPDTNFLTPTDVINNYTKSKSKLFFTDFYIQQRKRLNLLLVDDKPEGGQWSYDPENRKKLKASVQVPRTTFSPEDDFAREARQYVRQHFPNAIGEDLPLRYPTSPEASQKWLKTFISQRLYEFGDYEDAIHTQHEVIFHSVLTPMLNIGLLTAQQVVKAVLEATDEVPLNSLEGFVRQVIGWREFIRLVYLTKGRKQRTRNFLKHTHQMPTAFYDGTTGIAPVDHVIQQLLKTGYCHHIERLMILGNFMLLCEIQPDAVYQWFMEFFIDSYDWVMVPNVYGMSQYADGGFMTTKPYISGSSYVLKMSNFKKGSWCAIWDALYWRFIDEHSELFAKNPRMTMMVKLKEKLGDKLKEHRRIADAFLNKLHRQ